MRENFINCQVFVVLFLRNALIMSNEYCKGVLFLRLYVCMCVCIYVCMYIHMYECMYMYLQ